MPDGLLHGAVSGAEVSALQVALEQAGFSPGRSTASWSAEARAVRDYQLARGLPPTEIADDATWERLALEEASPTRGMALQQTARRGDVRGGGPRGADGAAAGRLRPGPRDGVFGPRTARAAAHFQLVHGLPVDG